MKRIFTLCFFSTCLFISSFANAAVDTEVAYIFNSFSFLVHGTQTKHQDNADHSHR